MITSSLSRVLRKPNAYQTISNFPNDAVRSLYLQGNCYALALRNARFEIKELHLCDSRLSAPAVADDGSVFYRLAGNDVIEQQLDGEQLIGPARDVWHVRLHTNGRFPKPLVGETPLASAYGDIALYQQIKDQQQQFLQNRASPSAVLQSDLNLVATQVQILRVRWNEQSKGLHSGGVHFDARIKSTAMGRPRRRQGHAGGRASETHQRTKSIRTLRPGRRGSK